VSNKLRQSLVYGRYITKYPTNTISAYGNICRDGKKTNFRCRNAYVIRDTMLYELFIGTVSPVNTEEHKEWKITLQLNRDPVTIKFDTWSPSQHTARTKEKSIQENQE